MFTLTLTLKYTQFTGFPALDRRRVLGLSDYGTFAVGGGSPARHFLVSEGFARTWFAPNMTGEASIPQDWMAKGELIELHYNTLYFADNLTVERAMELYIRAQVELAKAGE